MFGNIENLFEKAMNITNPWYIEKTEFRITGNNNLTDWEMHIWINFKKWAKFTDDETGEIYWVHDTKEKTYRHLDFFQYPTYIHIRVPRIKTKEWKTKMILMDFIRNNSGFTLLMEAFIIELVRWWMPVSNIAKLISETDTKIWNMLNIYGMKWREDIDLSEVKMIWVDETSSKKWHNYIAPIVDLEQKDIVFIWEWKKADVMKQFSKDLFAHNWDGENIKEVSMDLSPSFISWANKYFWKARIVFDKFHVMKMFNEIIDKVRKRACKWDKQLNNSKNILLMNENKLKEKQSTKLNNILNNNKELLEAYTFKILMQEFYNEYSVENARTMIDVLIELMQESWITEINKLWKSIEKHKEWILSHWENKTTNAILEWINSKIQVIKKIAKWFKNIEYFKSIIYIKMWRLNLSCLNPLL